MKNNWYVIIGAPCSGKTTILEYLEKKGYTVYYEWARIYIDQEMKKGRILKEIRKNELSFQRKILKLKVDFEKKLPKEKLIFMERGIPDSIAYIRMLGLKDEKNIMKVMKNCYYKKIFLLELLDYQVDYARTESREEAVVLDGLLEKSYKDLNLEVIRVPKISVEDRADFILKYL